MDDLREGTPIADLAQVVVGRTPRDAALAAVRQLPNRLLATADTDLADALIIEGAREKRHALVMQCDLRAHPAGPSGDCADLAPWPTIADPVHWAGILQCWREAFPTDHPDHFPGDDETAIAFLLGLVNGTELGPLHRSSVLVVGADDKAVAGVIVTIRPHDRPLGGPWITDIWRDPRQHGTGIGHRLINHVKGSLAEDGFSSLYLAVTENNPAKQRYQSEGFRVIIDSRTLVLPKART